MDPNATRFELALYVAPKYAEAVQKMIEDGSDNSLLLDIEKLVGIRIENEGRQVFGFGDVAGAEYGEGIAECYCEDHS